MRGRRATTSRWVLGQASGRPSSSASDATGAIRLSMIQSLRIGADAASSSKPTSVSRSDHSANERPQNCSFVLPHGGPLTLGRVGESLHVGPVVAGGGEPALVADQRVLHHGSDRLGEPVPLENVDGRRVGQLAPLLVAGGQAQQHVPRAFGRRTHLGVGLDGGDGEAETLVECRHLGCGTGHHRVVRGQVDAGRHRDVLENFRSSPP